MGNILNPKVQATGLGDVFAMGVSKQVTERLAKPVVGDGNFISALAKGTVGGLMYGKAGRAGNIVAAGLVVDAAEDAAVAVMNMFLGGAGGAGVDEWA